MNTLTDLLLGVGQPRVSHFPDLCTLLYTYLSTLNYWTKIVYYLFTQTSPVAHTSALTPTYIKSQKLPNWPISKELGLGRMLLPHWKLLFINIYATWTLTEICWFHVIVLTIVVLNDKKKPCIFRHEIYENCSKKITVSRKCGWKFNICVICVSFDNITLWHVYSFAYERFNWHDGIRYSYI